MDSNDSSANTTITFGDNAAPAHTTSEDEHVTASSSSDGKGKKSAEKRRQDIFRRQEMRKESRSRPSVSGSSQCNPGVRSSSATSSTRRVISENVKKKPGDSTPPTRRSPRGSPNAPAQSSNDASGVPHGSPPRDLPHGQPHGVDIRTVEELQAKLAEMAQEDEGATLRILQLERERDNALALVRHVHERHQTEHHQQEAQRHMYERYLQASEHEMRLQQVQAQELRDEAAQAVLQIGQQSQGEMFDMAKEYERITQMIHQKAVENSALRADLRLAEQLMMDNKEEIELSRSQEVFLATENMQTKQSAQAEEQYAKNAIQELRRVRGIASEEVAAERERVAQMEAQQRPLLPSLHEEIVHLRSELHVQGSELRVTRSELHAASARSSEWERGKFGRIS